MHDLLTMDKEQMEQHLVELAIQLGDRRRSGKDSPILELEYDLAKTLYAKM